MEQSDDISSGVMDRDAVAKKLAARLKSAADKLGRISGFAIAADFDRMRKPLSEAVAEVERVAALLARLSTESTYRKPDDYWFDVAWKPGSRRRALKKAARRAVADAYEEAQIAYREAEQTYHWSIEEGEASQAARQVYRAAEMVYRAAVPVYRAAEEAVAADDACREVPKRDRTPDLIDEAKRAVERAYAALEKDREAYRAAEEIYQAAAGGHDADGAAEQAYRSAEQVSDAAVEAVSAFLYLTDDRAQAFIDQRKNL